MLEVPETVTQRLIIAWLRELTTAEIQTILPPPTPSFLCRRSACHSWLATLPSIRRDPTLHSAVYGISAWILIAVAVFGGFMLMAHGDDTAEYDDAQNWSMTDILLFALAWFAASFAGWSSLKSEQGFMRQQNAVDARKKLCRAVLAWDGVARTSRQSYRNLFPQNASSSEDGLVAVSLSSGEDDARDNDNDLQRLVTKEQLIVALRGMLMTIGGFRTDVEQPDFQREITQACRGYLQGLKLTQQNAVSEFTAASAGIYKGGSKLFSAVKAFHYFDGYYKFTSYLGLFLGTLFFPSNYWGEAAKFSSRSLDPRFSWWHNLRGLFACRHRSRQHVGDDPVSWWTNLGAFITASVSSFASVSIYAVNYIKAPSTLSAFGDVNALLDEVPGLRIGLGVLIGYGTLADLFQDFRVYYEQMIRLASDNSLSTTERAGRCAELFGRFMLSFIRNNAIAIVGSIDKGIGTFGSIPSVVSTFASLLSALLATTLTPSFVVAVGFAAVIATIYGAAQVGILSFRHRPAAVELPLVVDDSAASSSDNSSSEDEDTYLLQRS